MAHELEILSDGSASMFSHREIPWHGLGTIVEDAPTSAEALKLAHLDWTVSLRDTYARVGSRYLAVPDSKIVVRDRDGEVDALGVVSAKYQPVQNAEAFAFLDALVDQSAEPVRYETAGSLRGGRQVFMSMVMPRDIVIDPSGAADTVKMFLMCTTGHTGNDAFRVAVTPIRPVCANTVRAGLAAAQSTWSHWHLTDSGLERKVDEARHVLGMSFEYLDAFEAWASSLYETAVTDKQFADLIEAAFPIADDATERQARNIQAQRDTAHGLWTAPTQDGITGTAWGAYNTLVEWSDYFRPQAGDKATAAERQLLSNLDGPSANFKARAQQLVDALVSA